ncbi:hypothetical protein HY641_04945 [Candidatus Woesearchaeota archaeon]|nr:hypothetical protein [Candidatus Woesearchaeota archaeon]
MFETVAVLVIFFFLIAFGLSFYFLVSKTQASKEYERTLQLRSITFTQKIATLPELDCVRVTVQVERCFDSLKTDAFRHILQNPGIKDDYFALFGYSNVTIQEIFPSVHTYQLYDRALPNASASIPTTIPILLRNPHKNTYSFGVLRVTLYA